MLLLGTHDCSQKKVFWLFPHIFALTSFPGSLPPLSPGFYLLNIIVSNSITHLLSSGYTVAWLPSRGLMSLVAAGAPRYQHVGQVLLFQEAEDKGPWRQIQKINGTQVSMTHGICRSWAG